MHTPANRIRISAPFYLGIFIAFSGCPAKPTPDAGSPVPVKPAPTEADLQRDDLNALPVVQSLGDQLVNEAKSRPGNTPTLEDLAAAVADAGVAIPHKQFLGRTVLARYCSGGSAPTGLGVSVCEYSSPEKAQRGMAFSLKAFAQLPNRTLVVRKSSVLTMVAGTAAAQAEVPMVKAVFEKLEGSEAPPAPVAPAPGPINSADAN